MVVGKLNYANRKIEGEKLAHVVKKVSIDLHRLQIQDVLKRVNSKSHLARDAQVDIMLSGKKIGRALDVICEGLSISIATGSVKLGELVLNGNCLTAEVLPGLTNVIRASTLDLRILDLRANELQLSNEEDLLAWQQFLYATAACRHLRVLDLADNPLGDQAIEYITMAFYRQGSLHTLDMIAETSLNHSVDGVSEPIPHPDVSSDALITSSSSGIDLRSSSNFTVPDACRDQGGLRALSCLRLENTSLTDAGALHLSYIVERCCANDVESKSIERTSRLNPYDKNEIILVPINSVKFGRNEFSSAGLRLLEAAERSNDPLAENHSSSPTRRRASTNLKSNMRSSNSSPEGHARNASLSIMPNELERARTKVQSLLLRDATSKSVIVMLWRTALSMFETIRNVFRHAKLFSRLPAGVWQQIIKKACDGQSLLSAAQASSIWRCATDADFCGVTGDWDGRLAHIRVFRLLDAVQCVSFEFVE